MELWIRSQDRKNLIKVNALYTDIPDDFGKGVFGVYCDKRDSYVSNSLLKIGTYKTKERTLEVLDEIQNILDKKKNFDGMVKYIDNDTQIIEFSTAIYEMPQEREEK